MILLLILSQIALSNIPVCSEAVLQSSCAALAKKSDQQWMYDRQGNFFRNPAYDTNWRSYIYESKNYGQISTRRQEKVARIAENIRKEFQLQITNGRAENELTDAEKNILIRIKTLAFNAEEGADIYNNRCLSLGPNANYSPTDHKMTICRAAMALPDSALAFIIGHEMAHAISPCNTSMPLLKIRRTEALKTFPLAEKVGQYHINAMDLIKKEDADYDSLLRSGDVESIAPAISPANYPFSRMNTCLRDSGFAEGVPSNEAELVAGKIVNRQASSDKNTPNLSENQKKELAEVASGIRRRPFCYCSNGLGSPASEAFSDLWGAKMAAKYFESNPPKDEVDRIGLFGAFIDQVCKKETPSAPEVHPPSPDRINRLLLSHPGIATVFQCQNTAKSCHNETSPGQPVNNPIVGH